MIPGLDAPLPAGTNVAAASVPSESVPSEAPPGGKQDAKWVVHSVRVRVSPVKVCRKLCRCRILAPGSKMMADWWGIEGAVSQPGLILLNRLQKA